MRILDTHEFNGKTYTRVEYDDGTTVELKNIPEDKVIETATKLAKLNQSATAPKPITTIADCTDEELTTEVTRRNLTLKGESSGDLMTAEIIYKHTWNVNDYCQIRYGDGSCIELSTPVGQFSTDQEWIDLALQLYENRPLTPDPMEEILRCCTDAMLVAEVLRRHLNITVEGGMV